MLFTYLPSKVRELMKWNVPQSDKIEICESELELSDIAGDSLDHDQIDKRIEQHIVATLEQLIGYAKVQVTHHGIDEVRYVFRLVHNASMPMLTLPSGTVLLYKIDVHYIATKANELARRLGMDFGHSTLRNGNTQKGEPDIIDISFMKPIE